MHRYAQTEATPPIRAKASGQIAERRHFNPNHILGADSIDANRLPAYKPASERYYRPC